MAREHLYMLVVDREGNLQNGAEVRILQPHSTNLISVPIYETDEGPSVIGNPFEVTDGVIDIYVDNPIRVRVGLRIGASAEQFIEDIDIGGAAGGGEHNHNGTGIESTAVGENATSSGDQSASYGVNASSNGTRSLAFGYNASSLQPDAIALGYQVSANGDKVVVIGSESNATASGVVVVGSDAEASGGQSVALGRLSRATAANSTAIGYNSTTSHTGSSAIGVGSSTTDENQVMLGTANHSVQVPGVAVISSPSGNQYELRVSDSGVVYTAYESRTTDTSILPPGDQSFSGGVGGWTSAGSTLSITNDASISPNPLLTIETASESETVSSSVEVSDSDRISGYAWVYASADFQISLTLEYLSAGIPSGESTPLNSPLIAEQWYKISTQDTVPSGVDEVRLKVVSNTTESSDVIYIESANIKRRE